MILSVGNPAHVRRKGFAMVEIDGRQAEGLHVIIVTGNDLSWDDGAGCLRIASDIVEDEFTPEEFNAVLLSGQLMPLQAISTPRHDFVLVLGVVDFTWGDDD